MNTESVQIQLGLFFKSNFVGQTEKASLAIKKEFGDNLETQIMNIPEDMPAEIPRLVLSSNPLKINLAKNRIDFFSNEEVFINNFEKISKIINSLGVEIGRIGLVITSFKEISIEDFKKIFDQERISKLNPKEINLRFNEEIILGDFKVNNSEMYTSGFSIVDGNQKSGVIVTRDINTLAEDLETNVFSKESLESFVNLARSKSKEIIL